MSKCRKKAFIGSIISTVGNLATTLINNSQQRKLQEQQLALQEKQLNQQQAFANANAMQQQLNNNGYVDGFKSKIAMKNGGAYKYDRIAREKQFACGGRKRMACGGRKTK